jgi:hypothetical protein
MILVSVGKGVCCIWHGTIEGREGPEGCWVHGFWVILLGNRPTRELCHFFRAIVILGNGIGLFAYLG